MYHQSHGGGDIFSPRGAFSQERHLFLHGGNSHADSGLVLSTDAKPRLKWTPELHQRFIEAVHQLGGAEKATPKTVMRLMGIPGLTLYHLKSHLQKYRLSKNLQAQTNNGPTKSAMPCVIPDDKAPLMSAPTISNSNVPLQSERTIQISEALQMQIEVQRQLNEQLEVQRHLQLRIEAQGKYLQTVLEKAQETLGKQNTGPTCHGDAKTNTSDLGSQVSTECFTNRFQDCSMESSLTTCEEFGKVNYNSNLNLKFEDSAPPGYYNPSRKEKDRDVNSNFGLANTGTKLDLNSHEENENTDSRCRHFDLNGLSWN
ncbi:myb-related protein 2-like isoform X3 [Carex rostrata]